MNSLILTTILSVMATTVFGQVTPAFRDSAIRDVLHTLTTNYVFPETAERAKIYVLGQKSAGVYEKLKKGEEIARQLTTDIQQIANDLHIRVTYSPEVLPELSVGAVPPPEELERMKEMLRQQGFGIKSKQILPGNIGYLNLHFFGILEFCADSLISAMQYVSGTDALILDLRKNRGSMDPSTIPFLSSYFFGTPTHLNDFYNRHTNDTVQSWSYGWVPGKRYINKPVYILTSGETFSGGEEFAYDFKTLKRATVIGERTQGGANPGGDIKANDHFMIFVPTGRAINPVTKTNWEGTGVEPDSIINANKALYKARILALLHLIDASGNPEQKRQLQTPLKDLLANPPVFKPVSFSLKGYPNASEVSVAGNFNEWSPVAHKMKKVDGVWSITLEAEPGKLLYKFVVDNQWINDPANKETAVEGQYSNSMIMLK